MPRIIAAALALAFVSAGVVHAPAHAGTRTHCILTNAGREICAASSSSSLPGLTRQSRSGMHHVHFSGMRGSRPRMTDRGWRRDPRPHAWCAWWLRRYLDIPRSAFRAGEYNLARAFRYIGFPAHGPHVGAIVVWWHHVGIITGRTRHGWRVKSGNDGDQVRERVRSLKGAIAFRFLKQRWARR